MSFGGHYADVYDALYHDKDYAREVEFTVDLLRRHAGAPVRRILDLGCGTGRHAIALAQRGYSVHGIDMSAEMLRHAQARREALSTWTQDLLTFESGDIRTVNLAHRYDAVLSLFHVMSYQTSDADIMAALGAARRHLGSGGVFLFDFWHGPAVMAEGPLRREKKVENGRFSAVRRTEPVWDKARDVVRVLYDLEITDLSSGETTVLQEEHQVRYFFRDRLAEMISRAGFGIVEQGEWLTGAAPRDDAFSIYMVLRPV